ncbi:hypothetical protein ACFOUV_16920 [Oceanobacillus longus]|uniref:Uncharacterized protein n=1 Tax=Oceanobacillus longus TaxID=930120 RepID=A0ABV8H5C8_9BACI
MEKPKLVKWNEEKCIKHLKKLYEDYGILNATTIHKYAGGMAKYIEANYGNLSAFCDDNEIVYLFKSGKNNWTEEKAIRVLKEIYEEKGAYSTSELQTVNSGLERFLRTRKDGVRDFCEKNKLSYVLKSPKKNRWTTEKAINIVKKLHKQYKEPVGMKLLSRTNYGGLYQWASKEYGSYKAFILNNGLAEYTSYQNNWNDVKCFRLIKDQFIAKAGKIHPESIKKSFKGAYNYIYNEHGGFENFLNSYDLQDYVDVNNTIYTDEIVKRKIKEAYTLLGDKVYRTWLSENGFGGAGTYLTRLGEGSFIEGARKLGLEDYVISIYTDWTDELVLEKVKEMLEDKGEPIISKDFETNGLTGMRDWIVKKHGGLKEFFLKYGIESQYANMKYVGKELWSYGLQFEELAKEAIELFFENVAYNKWVGNVRPDFILNEGIWIDTKLSSFAYFTDETVKKYTVKEECKELWLLYLRGHKFNHGNPQVKLISIKEWYEDLIRMGRRDLVDKFDGLREKVYEKERIDGKRVHK